MNDDDRIYAGATPEPFPCQSCGDMMSGEYLAVLIIAWDAHTTPVRCESCAAKLRAQGESERDSYFTM